MSELAQVDEQRRQAAAELTALMDQHESFSLVRLGDGETWWLIEVQAGRQPPKYRYEDDKGASVEKVKSVSGLESRHLDRFVQSLEQATYLDYCNSLASVARDLPRVKFNRDPSLYKNKSADTANIIFEWTYFEMRDYLSRHRCLFAGAEAALMRELRADPAYREIAEPFMPANAAIYFHQVRENGRHYSENLDLIKQDLIDQVREHNIDTVFLSLATGAKILVHELAKELGIRAIDFGSMPRALCYAGSPGYHSNRNTHNPYMFRVPLSVYAPALKRAFPALSDEEMIARVHSQLLLEFQPKRILTFNTTDGCRGGEVQITTENLTHFRRSERYYNQHYKPLALKSAQGRQLHHDFRMWCIKKGIGWQGKLFALALGSKKRLSSLLGKNTMQAPPPNEAQI